MTLSPKSSPASPLAAAPERKAGTDKDFPSAKPSAAYIKAVTPAELPPRLPFYAAKGTPAELEAMRADMSGLLDILSHARPHGSQAELDFIKSHILKPVRSLGFEPVVDGFGNIWVTVSAPIGQRGPNFLWSCHVDTVHAKGGRQAVQYMADGRTVELVKRKPGRCLGADDGAGVWLLLEMMRAGVAGGYVFHRGEEVGRLGSSFVADKEPWRLESYDACVAFDRRDSDNLITHQMGLRCASDLFASTLAKAINSASGARSLQYAADDTGSYTDSYSYAELVSECANMSVGYDGEHGPRESLDALHLWRLRAAMVSADLSRVVCERDCTLAEYDSFGGYGSGSWSSGYGSAMGKVDRSPSWAMDRNAWGDDLEWSPDTDSLAALVERCPDAVAALLDLYGLGWTDVAEHMSPSELTHTLGAGASLKVSGGGWAND
jgi:hypothetical protein